MKRETHDPWFGVACVMLLVAAAALRYRALGTTLFLDEIWVAELIRDGAWQPHAYNTPPLFDWICRAWAALRGTTDTAFREPAAFFGVALCAVPLFAPLPRLTRFLWSAALAFSSPLVFYSTRLKQYTLEAFVAAALLVLFLHWWEARSAVTASALLLAAAIGVTTLHTPVIVVGAMAVACIARPRMLIGFGAILALWALAYWGWLKPGEASQALYGNMVTFFTTHGNRWVTSPRVFLDGTLHWTGHAMNLVRFWWLAVGLSLGAWIATGAAKERKVIVSLLAILPVIAVVAASMLRVYPYGEVRLMIFAFPGFFLLIAVAIGELAERRPIFLFLLLLLVPFLWSGATRDPYNRHYMQLSDLQELHATIARSPATVYADPALAVPLRYYHPELDIRSQALPAPAGPGWYLQYMNKFTPDARSFVVKEGSVLAVRVVP